MPRRPGRPADELHRRIARMLNALTRSVSGLTRDQLMMAMRLRPEADSDVRKFRRDLAALRAAGWHIESAMRADGEHLYRLRVVDARIRATFNAAERAQLLRAAERAGLGQLYDDLDPERPEGTRSDGTEGLGTVQHAINHRCLLAFTYGGKPRIVDPFDAFFASNAWYLRGHEAGTPQSFKTFRLDRTSDLVAEAPRTAGPIPDLPAPNRDPMLRSVGDPVDAVVALSREDLPDAIALLGTNGWHERGGAGEDEPADASPDAFPVPLRTTGEGLDDIVLLEVRVTHVDAFLARLFEMDERVRLIGPAAVRERARELLLAATGTGL